MTWESQVGGIGRAGPSETQEWGRKCLDRVVDQKLGTLGLN